jgi:hypothetical protein
MTADPAQLEQARRVADAILYEGYLLYPYRQSSQKNQVRFQFGVLMPPAYRTVDECERSASQTECLLECPDDARLDVVARFLQLQHRSVQAVPAGGGEPREVASLTIGETEYTSWDEAGEREQRASATVADLLRGDREVAFGVGAGEASERLGGPDGDPAGRLVRSWGTLDGVIRLHAERVAGPYRALRLRVSVENRSTPGKPPRTREDGLWQALVAAHVLIGVSAGQFISMTDPPEWAAAEVAACTNEGTWPVLAGPADCRSLMLSSPVILPDHPEIAAESAGDLFDATEIDEILSLRTMALTEEEKRQARATDPRAAEIIDRLDGMPPEMLERMHGAIRYLKSASAGAAAQAIPEFGGPGGPELVGATARPQVPWWDPGADTSVSPETDHVVIEGHRVARGSRVRMRPGSRRADAQDLFLIGRAAVVEAVLADVDGQVHVAVTPEGDPAADLNAGHGRFLYFAPDELEPLGPGRASHGTGVSRVASARPHPAADEEEGT